MKKFRRDKTVKIERVVVKIEDYGLGYVMRVMACHFQHGSVPEFIYDRELDMPGLFVWEYNLTPGCIFPRKKNSN